MKKNLFAAAAFLVGGPTAAAKAHKFASAIEKVVKQEPVPTTVRVPSVRVDNVYVIHSLPQ